MAKAPADQFYWGDWLNDVELQATSACTRGVWINLLCRMWYSKVKGELVGSKENLALISNSKMHEFETFLVDAKISEFCYIRQNSNGDITLRNRRMYKKGKEQELNRLRQQRYYEKNKTSRSSNKNLTIPSSSSSSKTYKYTPSFEKFWGVWPEGFKVGKWTAFLAFKRHTKNISLEKIISAVNHQKKSKKWQDGYIPNPATWINGHRWEDDIKIETNSAQPENDPFSGDRFLKTANHLLTTPGYSDNDFSRHCYGHNQDPRIIRQKLIKITGGKIK